MFAGVLWFVLSVCCLICLFCVLDGGDLQAGGFCCLGFACFLVHVLWIGAWWYH